MSFMLNSIIVLSIADLREGNYMSEQWCKMEKQAASRDRKRIAGLERWKGASKLLDTVYGCCFLLPRVSCDLPRGRPLQSSAGESPSLSEL